MGTRGNIPKNTTNISSSGINEISQANDQTLTTANDLTDITDIANTVNESPEKKLLRRNTKSNATIVNTTHNKRHSELVNSLSDQLINQSRSSDASKRNESNTRGNEQPKETSIQENYRHYSSTSSKVAMNSQNLSSMKPQLKQNQTAPSKRASYYGHAGEGYESNNSAGQIDKQDISKSKSSADNIKGHDRSQTKSRPSPNSTSISNSKSIRQSISQGKTPQNTYVIEGEIQQQEYIAAENYNHNQASPLSVYKTPLSTTTLQNSKSKQSYEEKRKRKSVYLVGSQQQEHLLFEDEPSIIQGFVPNVESTRLVQNASTEESTSDNGSVRNTSEKNYSVGKNSPAQTRTVPNEAQLGNDIPWTNKTYNLQPSSISNAIVQDRDSLSNTDRYKQELKERLKSIGCWGNRAEVASNLLKQQKEKNIENATKEMNRENNNLHPSFKTKKTVRKNYDTLLNPREIAYHFERFSGLKLRKGCLSVLVDTFKRFTELYIKQLRKNNVGHIFGLSDIKLIMEQFGFIPKHDFKHRELYYLLRKILDPEDVRLLIPMSRFNGISGATTLGEDIWDIADKSNKKRSKKKNYK